MSFDDYFKWNLISNRVPTALMHPAQAKSPKIDDIQKRQRYSHADLKQIKLKYSRCARLGLADSSPKGLLFDRHA